MRPARFSPFVRRLRAPLLAVLAAGLWLAAAPALAQQEEDGSPWAPRWRLVLKLTGVGAHADDGTLSDSQEQSFRAQAMASPLAWLDYQFDYVTVFQGRDPVAAAFAPGGGAALHRYRSWRKYFAGEDLTQRGVWYHELDRAFAKIKTGKVETVVGRFPLAWGAGRIWQPTDLFAAFSPLTLDTEFKPGVDGVRVNIYPGDFSSINVAYLLSPAGDPETDDSAAVHFRSSVGDVSEVTAVAGSVRGKTVYGGSFETSFWDAGWLVEAISYEPAQGAGAETFAVAGVNGSITGDTTYLAEIYYNSLGARTEAELATRAALLADPSPDPELAQAVGNAVQEGRMPHLSRTLLGVGLQTTFGGLWSAGYSLLVSTLLDGEGARGYSHLQQGVLTYSVSNEAEAVLALAAPNGGTGSEFGAVPATLVFSIKFVL